MQKEFHFRQAEDSIFLHQKIMLAFQPRKDKLRKLFREASSSDDDRPSMQKEFHFRQAEDSIFLHQKIMLAFQPRKDKLRKLFREASSSDDDPVWDTYHVL